MDNGVTLIEVSVLSVTPGTLSAVPVVLSGVVKFTVATHFCPEKLEVPSVAWAKYWTAKVVVVFSVPPEQTLDVVNAVAL
jgi:hypothetical protein